MKGLIFWLLPAHAAPEARHEPTPEQIAAHHQDHADLAWDQLTLEARLAIAEYRCDRLAAEVRALTDDCGVLPVPLHVRSRLASAEQAVATLTAQLDQATAYIGDLTAQVDTLRARLGQL